MRSTRYKAFAFVLCILIIGIFIAAPRSPNRITSRAAGTVSTSKLGVFILQDSPGGTEILNRGPAVVNVLDPQANPSLLARIRAFRGQYPTAKIIMRVYTGTQQLHYAITDNPVASAQDYWTRALKPALDKLSASDKQLFDYMSGPVEYNNTPEWKDSASAQWYGTFWSQLADLIHQAGMKPNLGEIPVGNPEITNLNILMPPVLAALRKIRDYGGVWSYHAYTLQYTTDTGAEVWYSLRYRQIYTYLSQNYADLASMPMILTEAGVDQTGDPGTSGWQKRGDAAKYEAWLSWFDGEIKKDSYVIGATIFQSGDTYWSSFNIEPIASWFANYLNPSLTSPTPTSPAGTCGKKSIGDADCDGSVTLTDFEIFRKEYRQTKQTKSADFNGDSFVNLSDFEIWRSNKGR